eukprot:COSAG06_NODE_773_length_12432_cov_14.300332_6_plen_80_part_00
MPSRLAQPLPMSCCESETGEDAQKASGKGQFILHQIEGVGKAGAFFTGRFFMHVPPSTLPGPDSPETLQSGPLQGSGRT